MKKVVALAVTALLLVSGCSSDAPDEPTDSATAPEATATPEPTAAGEPRTTEETVEPVPYIPAGRIGSADDYQALIEELQEHVPQELRSAVPWPDLGNPDPTRVQIEIFELWIWMNENFPEPRLVEVMTAPNSPAREQVTGIFGRTQSANELLVRNGAPYQAFDHVVVTFESAGLPLWLGRDVPGDAVVVYYSDNSGPVDVIDRTTREFITQSPATPTRTWLSIMVPTDVGWRIWRDQLLDPSNGLAVPDVPPPPSKSELERPPEV